jgi:hypothetical protein
MLIFENAPYNREDISSPKATMAISYTLIKIASAVAECRRSDAIGDRVRNGAGFEALDDTE